MGSKFLILILVLGFTLSCSTKQFDTEQELWSYIKDPDNGYYQTKTVNGVRFSLLYKPTDLLVNQEVGKEGATVAKIDSLRAKYEKYVYFNLSMSRGNQELLSGIAGDRNRFGAMVNTLAFGMENKVHLYSEKRDTISMLDYVYPRMYGMSNNTSILLVYPRQEIKNTERVHLAIGDLGFGTGEVGFDIKNMFDNIKLSF